MTPDELRYIRKRIKRSQASLAQRLGVSKRTVINWETGSAAIPAATAELLEIVAGLRPPVVEPVDTG